MLTDGIRNGGTVLLVSGTGKLVKEAEAIFKKHNAHKVDEQKISDDVVTGAPLYAAEKANSVGDVVIPVIEEELIVGKRAVRTGGLRVVSRTVETPVEEQITLHEEPAVVERRPVDRAVTAADLHDRSIEVMNHDTEVHFATASAALAGDSQSVLEQASLALKNNADWKMQVVGHTDSVGSDSSDEKLAEHRAESVKTYLV